MKREIFKETATILLSLSLVLIFGCSKNGSLNQPDSYPNSDLYKNSPGMITDSPWIIITLPEGASLLKGKKSKGWTDTEEVKPDKKVKLKIKEKYESEHGKVEVEIKVDIKKDHLTPGSFITMTFEPSTGLITFLPHMIFEKIAKVSVKFKGLRLAVDKGKINFIYLEADGEYVAVDKKNIKVKYKDGVVTEISIKGLDGLNCGRYAFAVDA